MVILYDQATGQAKNFSHGIDAKEAMATGNYSQTPPSSKGAEAAKAAPVPEPEDKSKVEEPEAGSTKKGPAPVGDKISERIAAKKEEAKGKGPGPASVKD